MYFTVVDSLLVCNPEIAVVVHFTFYRVISMFVTIKIKKRLTLTIQMSWPSRNSTSTQRIKHYLSWLRLLEHESLATSTSRVYAVMRCRIYGLKCWNIRVINMYLYQNATQLGYVNILSPTWWPNIAYADIKLGLQVGEKRISVCQAVGARATHNWLTNSTGRPQALAIKVWIVSGSTGRFLVGEKLAGWARSMSSLSWVM